MDRTITITNTSGMMETYTMPENVITVADVIRAKGLPTQGVTIGLNGDIVDTFDTALSDGDVISLVTKMDGAA